MSDSDIDDVVDNQVNESVDWGVDLNENNGADNADRLETIIEESYISTVSKRPKSSEKSVIINIEKDISRSFTTEDGLCGSFLAPNRTSDSADFVGNGPDKQSIFDAEFEKLNSSGRRLQLPETFNAEKYNKKNSNMNSSWDKGPYIHTRTPPTTPRRGQPKIEEKKKPVRLRSEHKSQFRSTHVPTSTNTSTPKQREPVSRLPDWELSCINASNTVINATMNNTSGIPAQVVAQNIQSLPATANAQEVFAVLEKLRLEKLHKQTKRDQEKNSFFSSIKSKKKAVDVQRLATLEEEKLVSSPLIHASSIQKSAKKKTVELTAQITRQIIHSANAPAAIGPYSQAVRVDNTIYISGSLGLDPKTMQLEKGIKRQTHLALKNIGEILKAAGVGFENVVKTTVLLSDMDNYQTVNEIYKQYFTEKFPARAAYQVAALPKGGLVEIEAIAVVGKMKDI